jgi:Leucine-rich repeat (LRR) protein
MSLKLKNVLADISKIIVEMKNYNFVPIITMQPIIDRPPTYSYVMESEIVGRDKEKENIINALLDPSHKTEKVSVLPIVGMGGIGKTTLAQLVYNDEEVKKHFNLRVWVCVSNNFDLVNIIKSIIEVAKNEQGDSISNIEFPQKKESNVEVLQKKLRDEILAGKKYLLVLDDVWNEEIQKWDDLKTLLFSGICSGSAILVTTRSERVASLMRTMPSHDMAMLSKEDSWELFRKRAFGEAELPQELLEFGRKIVYKCAGLPLALKVIGGLMRTKRAVDEWRAISENKIWDGEASNNGILPALKLSYDLLPPYMKHCFAFCAIFSKDEEIVKEILIQLWKANNLIPNDEMMNHEDKGEYIFHELYLRSFFQDIEERENYYENGGKIYVTCKMHDLMHALAKDIAGKQCISMLDVENDQVLHMSVIDHSLNNLNIVLKKFPIIRTCLIHIESANESDNGKNSDSVKSFSLRALQMKYTSQLPKELGYMKHLRYLDLSWGKFNSLPETISTLYNLQTLDVSYSYVSKLPEDMRYMISLENLKFNGCENLKKMPIYLGKLKKLRTLTKYIVDHDQGRSIKELKYLYLQGSLILNGLENVRDRNEAKEANMDSKTKLYSLELKWDSPYNEETGRNDDEVLEGLKPYNELKHLFICGYAGCDFAVWMKDTSLIRNLRTVKVNDCVNCTKLPPICELPSLENLELVKMRSLVYICGPGIIKVENSEHLIIFPNLKKLKISYLDNLEGWHEQDQKNMVAFPKLEELKIVCCPKLKSIPVIPLLKKFEINHAERIKLLQISYMTMATSSELRINLHNASLTEPDAFRPPKNVETMFLSGLENVIPLEENNEENFQKMALRGLNIYKSNCFFSCETTKLSLGFWKYFSSLEKLSIDSCSTLSFWPEQEFRSLKCLKELCISGCKNFTYSSQDSSSTETLREEVLSGLEELTIASCPKLVEIPNCLKSLKVLTIYDCPSLSKEGFNLQKKFCELKTLVVGFMMDLKSLPDDLKHLTSLDRLIITACPEMESFPEGLQQRLSALQYLEIIGCPILEGRCENGGDYQHLVINIPTKKFSSYAEGQTMLSKMRMKRLQMVQQQMLMAQRAHLENERADGSDSEPDYTVGCFQFRTTKRSNHFKNRTSPSSSY